MRTSQADGGVRSGGAESAGIVVGAVMSSWSGMRQPCLSLLAAGGNVEHCSQQLPLSP